MKTIKVKFHVSTNKVGSETEEMLEIEIDEDMTKEEIDEQIQEEFETWVWENISTYSEIIK